MAVENIDHTPIVHKFVIITPWFYYRRNFSKKKAFSSNFLHIFFEFVHSTLLCRPMQICVGFVEWGNTLYKNKRDRKLFVEEEEA